MSYEINDRTLIDELCTGIRNVVQDKIGKIDGLPQNFKHPLDDEIIGEAGDLAKLLLDGEKTISYAKWQTHNFTYSPRLRQMPRS